MAQKNILTNFTVVAGVEGQNTLQSLAKQLDGLSFSAKKLSKDLQASSGATGIQQITRDADKAKVSVNGLTAALDDYRVKIAATTVIAQQFVKTLIGILEVQGRIDQLEVNLDLVNDGNTRKIGEDLEFLRDVTNRLGLEFNQTSVLYTKFAAATKESGFTAAEARDVFDSFAGATARLSLSTDSANRVFFALQQIVSKGTVSSEELKNQLGEKIPGVMAIAAKAFDGGKGDIEAFNKALADGKVRVDDFLIPFAEGIRESLGVASGESVNTATAAFGRFKNSYEDLLRAVVDSGLGDAVVRLFDGATGAIGSASEAIRDLKADTQGFFDAIDFDKLQLLAEVFYGLKGASVGAATGAAIGSAFPGVGTAVGAAVGAGVGYLGIAAGTNEVINQARFGKQEAFNELLERQAEIEQKIIEVTNRRDSAYGKNFLNQKALTEEIQALQMEGLNIDLQIINSSKEVSSAVVAYQKDISKSFADAEAAEKQAERERKRREKEASDAAEERLKQSKALQKELLALVSKESLRSDILREQIKLGRELTDTEKQYLEDVKKFGKVQAERLKSMRKENDLRQEGINLRKEEAKFTQALEKTARDEVKEYEARTKQLEEEIQRIGLKTEALAQLEAQSLLTQAAQAREAAEDVGLFNPQLYEARIRQAEELEKQAGLVKQRAAKETAVKIADDQARAFEKIQDDIAQSLTDAIFQGGKKGSEILKNLFKAQVFRIFIEPSIRGFVGSLAGAFGFGGAASASEGAAGAVSQASGLGNLVSGVKSAFDFVKGGFSSIGNAAFEATVKLADHTSLSLDSTLKLANGASIAAQYLAGIAGGVGAGRAISGGFAIGGGTGNSAVNIGTTIGAIAGGPIGALIGGALGGFANRLFGRKTVLGASGIQGDFTGSGLSNAQTFQDVTQKGGLFRSSRSFTQFGALDPKALKAINEAFGDVSKAAQDASRALGSNFTAAFNSFSLSGRLGGSVQEVLNNASNAFVTQIIDSTLGGLADSFKEFLNSIKQDQEQLIDAYVRVSRSVVIANRALFALGQTAQFSIRNAETAFEIITVLGDQGIALLDQFVSRFVPASQQAEIAAKNFELSLKNLGLETQLSANTTREEFRKLVQGLDLTTAAGQRQLQALLQIMPELDAIISRREQENAAIKALSASIEANVQRIRGDFQGLLDAIALRTDTTSLRITQAINSITAQPVIEFAAAISNAKPTDTVYRDFIKTVGSLQPSVGQYMKFVDSISGFTPNTAAYRAFTDAVSGIKPTDAAYKQFIASVQGLKPSEALYKAFIDAVSAAKPSSTAFGGFVADVQGKTTLVNQALDLLADQIDQLQDVVVTVNFSNFTTQINRVSADIARLGSEISNTTDVGARLQLEDQLQSAIIARYELEQQMLGGVFASIQELMGGIRNERVAVRDAATQILGGPRVLSADEIRSRVTQVSSIGGLPSFSNVEAAQSSISKLQQRISSESLTLSAFNQQLEGLNGIVSSNQNSLNLQVDVLRSAVSAFNNLSRVQYAPNAFAEASQKNGQRTVASFDQATQQAIFDYAYITFSARSTDEKDRLINQLRNQLNNREGEFGSYGGVVGALNSSNSIIRALQNSINKVNAEIDVFEFKASASESALAQLNTQLVEAEKVRAEAEQAFAEQLQQFVIDAGKAASQLGKLREETVRYFQEQQRLAQALMASSQGLRQTVADIRFADLNPQQQLAQLQSQFAALFSQASVLEGDALAAAGNDLNALINPILQKAGEVFASGAQFQSIKDALLAQAEQVAGRIESLTPVDYQQESLALLDTIDTTLALIEENTKSAEALIVDAIGQSADRTVAALSEIYRGITGNEIPAFAKGGMHSGGLRLVGERGPELEVTGPSRIIPNNQLMGMMRVNDNTEVVAELREANRLMQQQMRIMQATAQQNANDNADMKQELQTLRKKVALEASQ